MFSLQDWRIYENVIILHAGEESMDFDDEEAGISHEEALDQAWKIARSSPINILRDKNLNCVAILNNQVVGVLFDSWNQEEYSFDVIVSPAYQQQGIGKKLIDTAMSSFRNDSDGRDNPYIRAEVVNKNLVPILTRYGFKTIGQEPGVTFMTYGYITPQEEE